MGYGMADSGKRETFDGGAQREMAPDKGRFDLIPPIALRRLAVIFEKGDIKYNNKVDVEFLDLIDCCTCGNQIAIHTAITMLRDFAETAMRKICELVTKSSLSGSGKIPAVGIAIRKIVSENERSTLHIVPEATAAGSFAKSIVVGLDTGSPLRMARDYLLQQMVSAQYVETTSEQEVRTWIIATEQSLREGFCVHVATKVWDSSEIRKRVYGEHSPTCKIRQLKTRAGGFTLSNERNWEKGLPYGSFIDSGLRHINQWLEGDRTEDHLGQALWNIACLIHTEEMVKRELLPDTLANIPGTEPKDNEKVMPSVKAFQEKTIEKFSVNYFAPEGGAEETTPVVVSLDLDRKGASVVLGGIWHTHGGCGPHFHDTNNYARHADYADEVIVPPK